MSFPARVAAGYVLLAGLWILSSDWLLELFVSEPRNLVALGSWKGVAFVLVTGLMLYALLALRRPPREGATAGEAAAEPLPAWIPLLVFAILALVLGSVGYYVYRAQADEFRGHAYEQLGAVAELKGRQIEQWLNERRADAEVLSSGSALPEDIGYLERPATREAAAKRVRHRLEALHGAYDLASAELFGRDGRLLAQVGGAEASDPVLREAVAAAIRTERIQFSDLYSTNGSASGARIDFVIPLKPPGDPAARAVGVLALRADPQRFLFPLIQSWPMQSRGGETLLVRREGEEAVFLSRLLHVENEPFALRRPLSQSELPAVRAVLQGAGSFEGDDHRGVRVMTAFRAVPGSAWMVGVKMELDEVLTPLRQKAVLISALVGLAIGASALFVGFFWREQHNRYVLARYRDRLERQALVKHFDHVVKHARDIVLLMDAQGRILDANDAALAAYGYGREEMRGLRPDELRAPEARATLEQDMALAAQPGGAQFETVHRRKDGGVFPVEVSERLIQVEGKPFRQAIVRDITARRAAEAEIRRLTTAYALLSETNQAIVRAEDERELFERICRAAVAAGGYQGAWIGIVDKPVRQIRPVARAGEVGGDLRSIALDADVTLPEASGPPGMALREDRPYVCNDVSADGPVAQWRELARRAGARAVAAVPFMRADESAGVLNLYATGPGVFDARVVALLGEMAFDISFALENIAREEARRAAAKALQDSEAVFRSVVEQNVSAIFILADGRFEYVNPRAAEILGYRQGELEGLPILQLVAEPDRPKLERVNRQLMSGETRAVSLTFAAIRRNGSLVEIGAHGTRAVFRGKPVVIGVAQDISERKRAEEQIGRYVAKLEQAMLTTVEAVSAMVEMRDPYTAGHERRVGELAAAIGVEMGLPEDAVKGLRITGYVHDIGKIRVPAEILSKPGRLTANEFEIVKEHSRSGYEILKDVEFPWPVAQVILQHHERLDGSGYPQKLEGGGLMLEARILAVADVVESMASHRPYRPALGVDAALEEIERNAGRLYDPAAVTACLRLFREKGYRLPQ